MYCVGLTGNIGSGKSTAIRDFQDLGIDTVNADLVAREITLKGMPALKKIVLKFGEQIIKADGELDRLALRKIIFSDYNARIWLESLLHPLIKESIKQKLASVSSTYCVIEIPLLKNKADYPYLDRVLVILADKEQQIKRIMQRDNCDPKQALAILAAQPDELLRKNMADDLIINTGSRNKLANRIKKLHEKYLQFASEKSL